jgi:hypothetical protein
VGFVGIVEGGCRICVLGMVVFFVVCGVWWLCGVGLGGEFSNTLRGREGVRKFGKILTPFFGVPLLRKGNLSGGDTNRVFEHPQGEGRAGRIIQR